MYRHRHRQRLQRRASAKQRRQGRTSIDCLHLQKNDERLAGGSEKEVAAIRNKQTTWVVGRQIVGPTKKKKR